MSQNRGFRRDNRPMGNYGGRSGNQMNVNPWEGGLVPGGLRAGVAGLLPTPPQTSSLISQLSSPEAQLAIASNLLSTLLRPQQQQSQVPSLLSLGNLGQVGNAAGAFRQSGFGPDHGRFQDLGQNRRKGRMDQRRMEPYNKGRHTTSSKGGPERKSGGQGYRSPNVGKSRPASGSKGGSKAEKKDDKDAQKDKAEEDKANGDIKKPEEDEKRDEGEEGEEEKKREWKEEKKQDGEKNKQDDDSMKHGVKKLPVSKYSGIPDDFFFCHVCKKHMWDDHSFENHLKGRTHHLMMEKLDESYKIKVELMRHELQVAEQQREIEMERIKRQGKKVPTGIREYCTMCDLHFYGNIVVHRKKEHHQQLKNFLHPRCTACGKEFISRVEWDHHKLTPQHLKKAAEARKNRRLNSDDELGIEEFIGENQDEFPRKDMKVRTKEEEEKDIGDKGKDKDADKEGEKDDNPNAKGDAATTERGIMVDLGPGMRFRVPKYNPDTAVATSLVKQVSGFTCRSCRRFFAAEEDAQTHCRTLLHYNNYVSLLKVKLQAQAAKQRRDANAAAKKEDTEAKKKRDLEEKVDDEGNWKRRKVVSENEEEDTTASQSPKPEEQVKEEIKEEVVEEPKVPPGEEKYDPLEADAEAEAEAEAEKATSIEEPNPPKTKSGTEEEKLWAEVDRDIGTLLETVDDDDTETTEPAVPDVQARPPPEPKEEKTSPRTRATTAASNRGSPGRARGRKRK